MLSRAEAGARREAGRAARFPGHQGTGGGQAGAGSGGGGRPSPAHGRAAGRRQIHAGAAPALDPAADGSARDARSQHDRLARRRTRRRPPVAAPAVPCAASLGNPAGAGRRRASRQARRNGAGPSWRAVSRRTAGISAARARSRCGSRWRRARWWWRGPIITSPIRRVSR